MPKHRDDAPLDERPPRRSAGSPPADPRRTELTSRHDRKHRPIPHGRWARCLSCLALVAALLVGATAFDAIPASAQTSRSDLPIVAGTRVGVPGMRQCTVGAVLRATGLLANFTEYSRGIRYLLIAEHCAQDRAEVKVGGSVVGNVVWTAPQDDLELVRVAPSTRRQVVCSGASQLHRCSIVETVTPLAVGKVILSTPFGERPIPMRPPAVPGTDESFCTSGSSTGVNCSWITTPTPREGFRPGQVAAGHTEGIGVIVGDSGGPVVGRQGQFYGIIVSRGLDQNAGLMAYIPAERALHAVGSGYELAGLS
jgi:hypothetical protein